MPRVERSMDYRELEKEEEQLQYRLRTFKDKMQSMITPVSPTPRSSRVRKKNTRVRHSKRRQSFKEEDLEISSEDSQSDSSRNASLGLSCSDSEHSSSSSKATSITGQELSLPMERTGDALAEGHEFANTIENNAKQLLQVMQSETKAAHEETDEPTAAPPSPASLQDESVSFSPSTSKETPAQQLENTIEDNASSSFPVKTTPVVPPSSPPTCTPFLESNLPALNPFPVECSTLTVKKQEQTAKTDSPVFVCPLQDASTGVSVPTLPFPDHFANLFSSSPSAIAPIETTAPVPVFTLPFSAPATTETQALNTIAEPIQEVDHSVHEIQQQEDQMPQSEDESLPTSNYDDDFEDLNDLELENIEQRVISDSHEEEQSLVAEAEESNPISNPFDEQQGSDSSLPDELEGFSDTSF